MKMSLSFRKLGLILPLLVVALGLFGKDSTSLSTNPLIREKEEKFDENKHLADAAFARVQFDSAIYFNNKALNIANELVDSLRIANALIRTGAFQIYAGKYDSALVNLKKGLRISEKINYSDGKLYAITCLGDVYYEMNIFDKALDNFFEAYKIAEKTGDQTMLTKTIDRLGLIHSGLGHESTAIDYYRKSLNRVEKNSDEYARILNNIGGAYSRLEQYDSAKYYFFKSMSVAENFNVKKRLPASYSGLGKVYLETKDYDRAKYYLKKGVLLEAPVLTTTATSYYQLARLYYQLQEVDSAKYYLDISQELAKQTVGKVRIMNNYKLYASIFEFKNLYDSAYKYQRLYSELRDSTFNEDLANNLANIQMAVQKEATDEVIAQKDQRISTTLGIGYLLGVIVLLTLLLLLLIYRSYVKTKSTNQKISESKSEIEDQKKTLEARNRELANARDVIDTQYKKLKQLNAELENKVKERTQELQDSNLKLEKAVVDLDHFIYKSSHDLRGPIATMQGIIHLGLLDSKDLKALDYFMTLRDTANRMNNLLYNLITVHESYQKPPEFIKIELEQEILSCIDEVKRNKLHRNIEINTTVNTTGDWNTDPLFFRHIIENMMSSAFLFARRQKPRIDIVINKNGKDLQMDFIDNGYGIPERDVEKIFKIFYKGSPSTEGTGLELYTAKIASEKLRGNIHILNLVNDTHFKVVLPVIN